MLSKLMMHEPFKPSIGVKYAVQLAEAGLVRDIGEGTFVVCWNRIPRPTVTVGGNEPAAAWLAQQD